MASQQDDSMIDQLIIYGYLRSIINDENDYSFILAIILSFYQQGFAKYYEEKFDKDYKQKMRFGDILRSKSNDYMVLNINNELQVIGCRDGGGRYDVYIDIGIPYSICQYLSNAVSFYSKIHELKPFKQADDYQLKLHVKHNDEWIIKHFDGPLDPQYESICIYLDDGRFQNFGIVFVDGFREQWFNPIKRKISYKDIEKYYELRKDCNNLVKFGLVIPGEYLNDYVSFDPGTNLWENRFCEYFEMFNLYSFIGPKSEKDQIVDKFKLLFGDKYANIVSIDEITETDYISSEHRGKD